MKYNLEKVLSIENAIYTFDKIQITFYDGLSGTPIGVLGRIVSDILIFSLFVHSLSDLENDDSWSSKADILIENMHEVIENRYLLTGREESGDAYINRCLCFVCEDGCARELDEIVCQALEGKLEKHLLGFRNESCFFMFRDIFYQKVEDNTVIIDGLTDIGKKYLEEVEPKAKKFIDKAIKHVKRNFDIDDLQYSDSVKYKEESYLNNVYEKLNQYEITLKKRPHSKMSKLMLLYVLMVEATCLRREKSNMGDKISGKLNEYKNYFKEGTVTRKCLSLMIEKCEELSEMDAEHNGLLTDYIKIAFAGCLDHTYGLAEGKLEVEDMFKYLTL